MTPIPDGTTSPWTPRAINGLIVVVVGCLCLSVLVISTMLGVMSGRISPTALGTAQGLGIGGGIVGLASIIVTRHRGKSGYSFRN